MDEQNKKRNEYNADLDAWDDFVSGAFIKPVNVENDKEQFKINKIEATIRDNEEKVVQLTLEKSNKKTFLFDLNKTNANFLVMQGVDSPNDLINHSICFKKVLVRNPKTNQEVESLRIHRYLQLAFGGRANTCYASI